jgi:hypothetical protein
MYTGGVAALSAHNYRSLYTLLLTKLKGDVGRKGSQEAVISTVDSILEIDRMEVFKMLPGHDRQHTPRSEYLFKTLQPELEDLLFLGNSYEDLFDRFEILYALTYADLQDRQSRHFWGPPGRFAWKGRHGDSPSPYETLTEEARQQGVLWPPLQAGMFSGSSERFAAIATAYREQILNAVRNNWF